VAQKLEQQGTAVGQAAVAVDRPVLMQVQQPYYGVEDWWVAAEIAVERMTRSCYAAGV